MQNHENFESEYDYIIANCDIWLTKTIIRLP
jgi:hypothetical protein